MMRKYVLGVLILFCFLSGCSKTKPTKIINIQPLGDVSNEYILTVKKSIKSFYGYDCKVLPQKEITNDIISKVTKRIEANKVLDKFNSNINLLVLTEKDICYFKDKNRPEYGIFGLGGIKKNNNTCIVSTFRLKLGATKQKTLKRLEKVTLHEIGHNLGLYHCENNEKCMMSAARGTIKLVDNVKVWFCEKCMKQIKK
jgi:archaemetzincin